MANQTDLAAYSTILMSEQYYDRVLKAVTDNDLNAFRDICREAEIPMRAVNELWAAAIGTQSTEAQTMSAGW